MVTHLEQVYVTDVTPTYTRAGLVSLGISSQECCQRTIPIVICCGKLYGMGVFAPIDLVVRPNHLQAISSHVKRIPIGELEGFPKRQVATPRCDFAIHRLTHPARDQHPLARYETPQVLDAAIMVEAAPGLELLGIGTNLGCYGSVMATEDKLKELVADAEAVEEKIGRRLAYISGGATSSIPRILEGNMPERINMLRIGEGIIVARDLIELYG